MNGFADIETSGQGIVLSGETYAITFSAQNGSIVSLAQKGQPGAILRSGEQGLWQVRFHDGKSKMARFAPAKIAPKATELRAADFGADSSERAFKCEADPKTNTLRMTFQCPEITVTVTVLGRADGVGFTARVSPRGKPKVPPGAGVVLDFALPARLRFDPNQIKRFICPMSGNQSVGTAFKNAFFKLQPQDKPSGWRPHASGPKGYALLYGGPLDQRADHDPATALKVTQEGRAWFSADLARRIEGAQAVVNRPPKRNQADLILVDSPNGPYFSATHLGGKGFIWRVGGAVGDAEERIVPDIVMGAVNKLAESRARERKNLGVLSLTAGPDRGGWTAIPVRDWLDRFRGCPAARSDRVQVVELTTVQQMADALKSREFLVILNPYGEWIPTIKEGGVGEVVQMIGQYVRAGGNWFEVSGYPFHYEMLPVRFLRYETTYPDGFADFFHLDTLVGSASIYRIQPQKWAPWEGAKNREAIFVPGRLGCGADEQGGYCDRPFCTYVPPGETWSCPTVRLTVGKTVSQDLHAYCESNEIKRRLEDKMAPELLSSFKSSALVYYAGSCKEKMEGLDLLPVPSLIHFSDYLKGGFDKEYPDHLPPRPDFGTPEEFRAFFDRCHALGHLVMPYTNPTWWCDHPKGPTFEREGDAPLLKTLEGKASYERYAKNDGYTVCHWHPAVQAANRKTVREFTDEYPVDVLFQDQCGARGWRYDTNLSSPTVYAYSDGLISMVAEDCKTKPLSTESGWDRVVNYESQLCGMTWGIVPTEGGPSWRRLMKFEYPPETWEIFPLAEYIAHDKAAMVHHDLGQFVTNRQTLAWTLGLGFCMSYRVGTTALKRDAPREWLRWLDRIQKSVCSRYLGEPVRAFEHDRGPAPTVEDDGLIRAEYGPVKVVANLGPGERLESGRELPPYGFYVTAPGVVAANLKKVGAQDFGDQGISFMAEGSGRGAEVWVYAPPQQEVAVELPAGIMGEVSVAFDGGPSLKGTVANSVVSFRLPHRQGGKRIQPPATLADMAPRDWPGAKPAIGILDLGPNVRPSWTRITPEDWVQTLQKSRFAQEFRLPIVRIQRVDELVTALKAGPPAYLAIINPYGEIFPATAAGKWREMLDLIRDYVNRGGCWWETAGYSFYAALYPQDGGWKREAVGPWGMGYLGIPVGAGEVEAPAERLSVPSETPEWLGNDLSARISRALSIVNRGLTRGADDPGHVTLVAAERQDFIGGYRLEGWGWFWRIGGFWPNPDVALPAAVAAMEYIYTHPPLPVKPGERKYLWHVVVKAE